MGKHRREIAYGIATALWTLGQLGKGAWRRFWASQAQRALALIMTTEER